MSEPFDIETSSPDEGHEEILRGVRAALAEAAASLDESYFLSGALAEMVGALMATTDDLTTRLVALEQWRTDLAAASTDVLRVDADTDVEGVTVWTWSRVAPDGEVIATGGPHTSEVDCWTAAHRANPDL